MPTPEMKKRVAGPKDLRKRLEKNLLSFDKHLDLGGLGASPSKTNKLDPDAPAGKALDFDAE